MWAHAFDAHARLARCHDVVAVVAVVAVVRAPGVVKREGVAPCREEPIPPPHTRRPVASKRPRWHRLPLPSPLGAVLARGAGHVAPP